VPFCIFQSVSSGPEDDGAEAPSSDRGANSTQLLGASLAAPAETPSDPTFHRLEQTACPRPLLHGLSSALPLEGHGHGLFLSLTP